MMEPPFRTGVIMNTSAKGAGTGTILLAAVLGIIIGAVGGFYVRFWNTTDASPSRPTGGPEAPAQMAGGRGAPGGGGPMAGGGGGMMGGGAPPAGTQLARTVRNLATIQKVQGQGLTPAQAKTLLPLLKAAQGADRISVTDAEKKLAVITGALTDAQKQALESLQPARGMRGGGGGGAPSMPATRPSTPMMGGLSAAGGGGAAPGGGPMGGGMGGGSDPEKPFESERNKAALDDLVKLLEGTAR
jgi:hypothetical protein